MKCEDYRETLMDAARGCDNAGALAHARGCPKCTRILREQQSLSAALRAFADNETAELPEALESRLLAHFDPPPRRRLTASRWAVVALTGAAAALVAAIFLVQAPSPPVKALAAVAPKPAMSEKSPEPPIMPHTATIARRRRTQRPKPVEVASQDQLPFMPVPYAAPLLPTERLEIVRVNLPANALTSMGVPVIGLEPETRLNADLVIGENGLARAVRLVRTSLEQ
jgi:hypothetical protein